MTPEETLSVQIKIDKLKKQLDETRAKLRSQTSKLSHVTCKLREANENRDIARWAALHLQGEIEAANEERDEAKRHAAECLRQLDALIAKYGQHE